MFDLSRASLRSQLAQKSPLGVFWMNIGSATVMELAAECPPRRHRHRRAARALGPAIDRTRRRLLSAGTRRCWCARRRQRHRDQPGARHRRRGRHRSADRNRHAGGRRGSAARASRRTARARAAACGRWRTISRAIMRQANDRTVVGVMIETQRGVHNARRDRQHTRHRLRADRHRRSRDLARRFSERRSRATSRPAVTVFDACKAARVPCGIFTMYAEAAAKRRHEGYALVAVANDIDVVSRGFTCRISKFQDRCRASAHNAAQGAAECRPSF